VAGFGPWTYIDTGHAGAGCSAEVSLRSDEPGERITGIYDVFATPADAAASFDQAYSNFRRYSPAGSFVVLQLDPSVNEFCAPQAVANTTACWFLHGSTTGYVDATIPSPPHNGGRASRPPSHALAPSRHRRLTLHSTDPLCRIRRLSSG
jgi:hypothetical protein